MNSPDEKKRTKLIADQRLGDQLRRLEKTRGNKKPAKEEKKILGPAPVRPQLSLLEYKNLKLGNKYLYRLTKQEVFELAVQLMMNPEIHTAVMTSSSTEAKGHKVAKMAEKLIKHRGGTVVLEVMNTMRGKHRKSTRVASAETINEKVAGREDDDSSSGIESFDGMGSDFGEEFDNL